MYQTAHSPGVIVTAAMPSFSKPASARSPSCHVLSHRETLPTRADAELTAYHATAKALPGKLMVTIGGGGRAHIRIQVLKALCAAEVIALHRSDHPVVKAERSLGRCTNSRNGRAGGNRFSRGSEARSPDGFNRKRSAGY
jgi:hypothetical protein